MASTYVGTKTLIATPMTRGDYNTYRGWDLPSDEDGGDPGYLVESTDASTPNHPDHVGYISWSPKEQFDTAYVELDDVVGLLPYQVRVVAEYVLLKDKTRKLLSSFNNPAYLAIPYLERQRLLAQSRAMTQYLSTLEKRIAEFAPVNV